jgi:hypothetical protein
MAKHEARRRGAAFALAGAVLVGGAVGVGMTGVGSADPLPATNTTYVLPDLAPFTASPPNADTRGAGAAEVTDEFGAPEGGHKAALKLSTPASSDKVQVITSAGGSPLAEWVGNAGYSAYQDAADNPVQFPAYQLFIDYNGPADGGYSTLDYEPVYNSDASTTPMQWNRYDVGAGKLCSTKPIPGIITADQTQCSNGGTHTLAEYAAAAPDATVTAVLINQGTGNPGLVSAVDKVQAPTTSYDFELKKPDDGILPPITIPPLPTGTTEPPTTEPSKPGDHGGHGQWGDKPKHDHCGCQS